MNTFRPSSRDAREESEKHIVSKRPFEMKPCPCCGKESPFTYISFSCAVLECSCGLKMKDGAVLVMYKREDLPEALKPYAYEPTLLVMKQADGSLINYPEHGYIGVDAIAAFHHSGALDKWNTRTNSTEE